MCNTKITFQCSLNLNIHYINIFGIILPFCFDMCHVVVQWLSVQTFPNLCNICIPEGWAQVELLASQSWAYVWSTVYVYYSESTWNPNSCTPKSGRLQHDCPPHMSSLSGILPPCLSHCALMPAKKNVACISVMLFIFVFFLPPIKLHNF
jgi:hypothetical protein